MKTLPKPGKYALFALALILFAPRGILGTLREKGLTWLP